MFKKKICSFQLPERDHSFQVEIFGPDGGAQVGKIGKTIVTLVTDAGKYNKTCNSDNLKPHVDFKFSFHRTDIDKCVISKSFKIGVNSSKT